VDNSGAVGTSLYTPLGSISNAAALGSATDVSSYLVASSNVTFDVKPEKINERNNGTLYILNCSDAYGWWITGYTAQSLAEDLNKTLAPYFNTTVIVQNTQQLAQILDGTRISSSPYENVTGAIIINTCGEAVPIPSGYYSSSGVGYDSAHSSYALYSWTLGKRVLQYNWTWVSIVGWPLYYVSNNALFDGGDNGWGIYGMNMVSSYGLSAFLQGLDNQTYSYTTSSTGSPGVVPLSSPIVNSSNYYGIYPSSYQTSTRALSTSILGTYNLNVTTYVFDTTSGWNPGALYRHVETQGGTSVYNGGFLGIGLTRTPDIRITALGLLTDYKPRLYASNYMAYGTSRLVVLQLGLAGGT
jgi:hypothetical protein